MIPLENTELELSEATSKASKCAHAACTCITEPGERFCSDVCEAQSQAASETDHACACDHAGCDGRP